MAGSQKSKKQPTITRTFKVGLNAFYTVIWFQTYGGQGVECGGLNKNVPIGSYISMLGPQLVELFGKD